MWKQGDLKILKGGFFLQPLSSFQSLFWSLGYFLWVRNLQIRKPWKTQSHQPFPILLQKGRLLIAIRRLGSCGKRFVTSPICLGKVPTSRFSLPWPKCFNFTSFGKPVFAGILGKLLQDGFFPISSSGCFLHYNTFIVTISAGHYPITVGRKWCLR